MINRVVLIGRLTKDLELRYTQSGVAVARFNLAVNRQFKDKQTGQDVTVENFSLLEPRQNGNQFNYQDNQANNYQANQGYNPAQGQSAEPNTGQEPGMGNTPLPF